jgi:hypothetical protein
MCPCPQVGTAYQPISGGKNAEIKKRFLKLNGLFLRDECCLFSQFLFSIRILIQLFNFKAVPYPVLQKKYERTIRFPRVYCEYLRFCLESIRSL